jgi:hypothetical protein
MDEEVFTSESMTCMRMSYGELEVSVMVATNLSPDAIDTTLNDVRKQLVAGARQLGMEYVPGEASADED